MPKSCAASTPCSTPSCCRSAKATAILAQISTGKIDELIAQTYKGDHERMKQAVNNVGVVLQGLQKEMARLTDASKDGQLRNAARRSSSRALTRTSCAASTIPWMP